MPSVNWDSTRLPLLDTANLFSAPESSRPGEQTFGVHLQGRPPAPPAPAVNPSPRSAPPAPPPVDNSRREPSAANPSPAKEPEASSAAPVPTTPPAGDTNERTQHEDQESARAATEGRAAEQTTEDSATEDGIVRAESAEQTVIAEKTEGTLEAARKLKAKLATASSKRKTTPSARNAAATDETEQPERSQGREAQNTVEATVEVSLQPPVEDPSATPVDTSQVRAAEAEVASRDSTTPESAVAVPIPIAVDAAPLAAETPVASVSEERAGRRGRQASQAPAAPEPPNAATAFDAAIPGIAAGGPIVTPEAAAAEQLIEATHGAAIGQTGVDGTKGTTTHSVPVGPQQRFAQHLAARVQERPASAGPTLTEMEQTRIIDRVARAFRTAESREGTVTLRLHPPELGVLRVELQVREGVLSAHLEAETPAARTVLLDNVHLLRDRLAEQGVRIERFDVDLLDQRPTPDGSHFEQPRHQDQPHSRGAPISSGGIEPSEAEAPRPAPRPLPGQLNVII